MLTSTRRCYSVFVTGLVAAIWIGCDSIVDPPLPSADLPLILSDTAAEEGAPPAQASTSAASAAVLSGTGTGGPTNVTFVSLSPGAVRDGVSATIRNQQSGDALTVAVIDGGFDPVPIEGNAGDTLVIDVQLANSSTPLTSGRTVPPRRPPRIVRTNPPPKKRDVALNASVLIVFSEPVNAGTVADATVQLLRAGARVAGRIEPRDGNGLTFAFVPAAPLAAATDYELIVTQDIRDLDGDQLDMPAAVPFTTRSAVNPPNASLVLVPEHAPTIQAAVDAVTAGGVIRVRPGVYAEAVSINKGVTIERSTEAGEVRIVPPNGVMSAITITASAPVTLRRLTVDHLGLEPGTYLAYGEGEGRKGILGTGAADITIVESTILRANAGVVIENDSAVTHARGRVIVLNSTIDGGEGSRMDNGVWGGTDVDVRVERTTVRRTKWACLQVQEWANGEFIDNDVDMCGVQSGIRVWLYGTTASVIGNTVRNSDGSASRVGIFFNGGSGVIERNSIIDYVQPNADANWAPAAIRLNGASVTVRFNDISGNRYAGLRNITSNSVDASCNWWGAADGPSGTGGGSGDAVVGLATFVPFATAPIARTATTTCSGVPPVATQMAFTVQPSTTVAGTAIAPAIRVTAQDAAGRPSPTFSEDVTLALAANPGGATLQGSTTVRAVNGVATFYNVRLDRAGSGYLLMASAAGLAPTTSVAFDVTPRSANVAYASDFESPPGPEWSSPRRSTVPNDMYPSPSFLGEFGCIDYDSQQSSPKQAENCREADAVSLTLGGLPQHDEITITFDLYLIRSWDGNPREPDAPWEGLIAPDVFNVSVVGGPTLLNATFAVHHERHYQSYPAQYSTDGSTAAENPRHTGALAIDALGYGMDAVYRLTFTFAHTGPTVTVRFTAPALEPLSNESWGLDNVEVRARVR